MTSRYDVDRVALAALLDDQPAYRVGQVWSGLYERNVPPEAMTDLPKGLRERLADALPMALVAGEEHRSDDGETRKWLWTLADGARIETVLMHYPDRATVCISTQAGCAMACGFCATGQAGFERNLTVGEIVEQVARAREAAAPRRVSNVVFMGMGEPMANFDRTWEAVHRLHDDMVISARHLTVSTVGVIPGIRRLAAADLPVNLAVSLHSANDQDRDALVPINRRYPLDDLRAACRDYVDATRRRLSLEWALIDGVNDRRSDVRELGEFARDLRAHVNLIPLNPTPGYPVQATPPTRVQEFAERLRDLGVNATVRRNRGNDIEAACGQLRAAHEARPIPVALSGRGP